MKKRRVLSWILIWTQLQLVLSEDVAATDSNFTQNDQPKDLRGLFSPRMDYDQWKPLGRGDPLKNDPTYDYVPPVLDRVHYWIDPALRKPDPPVPGDNQKTEILLLGVSSKKPSTGTLVADSRKDTYDSFLKFVDGPKFNNQRNTRPHFPTYFTPNFYPKNKNFQKNGDQRTPYTMLMPPPMVTKRPTPTTSIQKIDTTTDLPATITSTSSANTEASTDGGVTIQSANLIYHSSSLSNFNEWKTTETATNLTPNPTKKLKEEKVFPKLPQFESYIQFSPPRNLTNLMASGNEHNINYVTPPPLQDQEIMHKGQVSDDNLDISNTYVKIGKTEAQVHSTAMDNISEMLVAPSMVMFPPVPPSLMTQTPLTMQTIQNMQSMQPPPITTSPIYKKSTNPIRQILEKEKEETTEMTTPTTLPTTTTQTSLTTDPLFKHYKQPTEPLRGPLYLIIQGHSKVKTYGPSKQFHGIRVQETNEIVDDLTKSNDGGNSREARSRNLQTLKHVIETRLGAIDFGDLRRTDAVKETELQFGYKVGEDVTSEKYHKGIVEEARKLQLED